MIARLAIEDLEVRRGDRPLFRGFGLELAAGEAAALTGANGAGKTSLLRTVAGFIAPARGRVAFAGPAGPLDEDEARGRDVHLVGHQEGLKSARSARSELLFQAAWTGGSQASALAAAGELGLTPLLDLEVRRLSAGQRRRLALARLLASPRSLWLLDEPLAPLDARHRELFGEAMQRHLLGGGLILAAVHDPLPIPARTAPLPA
ncbi:MAG: heme ABC exporter ATP-binding protein CcmA [Caulobacteraceae bacterium]|nr:heme ABC exporter ATP-binding protein CcmA [Caulobacteraceae bacterium]